MNSRPSPIWDLPTRLFHWSLPPLLETNFYILLALIVLHVGTVLHYLRRGQNLLGPMIGGGSSVQGARVAASWIALLILAACAGMLWFGLSLVPKPMIFY